MSVVELNDMITLLSDPREELETSESAASEPAASEPAASEPAASEPAASEPAASEPAVSESGGYVSFEPMPSYRESNSNQLQLDIPNADKWNEALDKYDPPSSAVVWVVWLIGQLTISVLLLTLTGFHFGLVRPDLCNTNTTINSMIVNNSTDSLNGCAVSGAVLTIAMIACLLSIVDATVSLHYLIHTIRKNAEGGNKNEECENGTERPSCKYLSSKQCRCISYNFPLNTVRVWYCWILVHVILLTIAVNTYTWSWNSNDLQVLVNTAIFFLTCAVYMFFVVAMLMWHGCCYCCTYTEEECCQLDLIFAPMLTAGLIVSSATITAATLVIFYYPTAENSISPIGRVICVVSVFLYIFVTSSIWLILLSCSCTEWIKNYSIIIPSVIGAIAGFVLFTLAFISIAVFLAKSTSLLFLFIVPPPFIAFIAFMTVLICRTYQCIRKISASIKFCC